VQEKVLAPGIHGMMLEGVLIACALTLVTLACYMVHRNPSVSHDREPKVAQMLSARNECSDWGRKEHSVLVVL